MQTSGVAVAFAEGARCWPELRLDERAFERYLHDALGSAPAPEWGRHAADLYLCCGCLQGDPRAQRILEERFLSQLSQPLARISSSGDFLREVLQMLRARLLVGPLPRLRAYSGRGPLLAWLKVAATRLAVDALRAGERAQRWDDNLESAAAREVDPLVGMLKARYGEAFQRALHEALRALSERDRNVLRLRLVDCCSIDRLGCIYQVDRATAARWLKSAKEQVLRHVRQQLSAAHQLTQREFQSLARVVLSQLELRPSAFADPALPEREVSAATVGPGVKGT